jgi:RNA polymerase sigma factor (sigma-70 family)
MSAIYSSDHQIELDAVVRTEQLYHRAPRQPDYEAENRALVSLAQVLANPPRDILQRLVEAAIDLCQGGSAGISIIEDHLGEKVFRWHALTGALASHRWGTTPRDFSPCGTVIDRNAVQLMHLPERHFLYFSNVKPQIVEALLVPFSVRGQPVGTIWVVTHDDRRKFDAEDERLIKELAQFATEAYQLASSVETSKIIDRRKDEFLAMLAHELRSPLSAMDSAMQYIRDRARSMDEPQLQAMSELGERQLKSMKRMINDLLDISSISLDKVELDRSRVEISWIAQHAVEAAQSAIDAGHHKLTVSMPESSVWLHADAARLTQVLSNVLSNAAKYTPEGGHIGLYAEQRDVELLIRVRDNGIGIDRKMLLRVFDPFVQRDISSKRARGGLGIGLSLVRRLVELHGGTVKAYSEGRGKGSEFQIRLPVSSVDQTTEATTFAQSTDGPSRLDGQGLPASVPNRRFGVAPARLGLTNGDPLGGSPRTIVPRPGSVAALRGLARDGRNNTVNGSSQVNVASASDPASLLQRMRWGDQCALEELYDCTVGSVYALAKAILKSSEDAEEVVCDTYARAWRQSERFDPERASPIGWLMMMCRSGAIDRLRHNRSRGSARTVALESVCELANDALTPQELLSLFHDGSRVQQALAALSPQRLKVVGLAFFEGLSFPEIAERTGMPLGTVKSHIRRGLAELRRKLDRPTAGHPKDQLGDVSGCSRPFPATRARPSMS